MTGFDKQLFGPPDDTPIIPWYEGAYDRAFIALHPFFAVKGLDPRTCEHGTLILSQRNMPDDLSLLEWGEREQAKRLSGKELGRDSLDDVAKLFGASILWREICGSVGFADHRELNLALRTHIQGLKKEFADPLRAKRLTAYCDQRKVFLPTEGTLQPLMERSLVQLFNRVGLHEVVVGDEFGDNEHLVSLTLLDTPTSWRRSEALPVPFPRRLIAKDRSLLVSVHWDSFFTIILGKRERLSGTCVVDLFEGFWCSHESSIDWLFEPCIPLV